MSESKTTSLTLSEVRALAVEKVNISGVCWMHADRRDMRIRTESQWTAEQKAAFKVEARKAYPWRRITILPPQAMVASLDRSGRDLI